MMMNTAAANKSWNNKPQHKKSQEKLSKEQSGETLPSPSTLSNTKSGATKAQIVNPKTTNPPAGTKRNDLKVDIEYFKRNRKKSTIIPCCFQIDEVELLKFASAEYDKQKELEKQKSIFDRIMAYTSQNYNKQTNKFQPPINAYVGD